MIVVRVVAGLLIYTMLPSALTAQSKKVNPVSWTVAAKLPPVPGMDKQPGVAGVFTGVSHNRLIIAGGAYFPDKKPWEGGKKAHTNQIFILKKQGADQFTWLASSNVHLKNKIAYGASVTIGNDIVCAGGETETAGSTRDAFIVRWDIAKNEIIFHDLPLLPIPVANACMAGIGRKIYLIGGESNGKPSDKVFMLDLAAARLRWETLPGLPLAMSHSVALTQSNGNHPCVYVIGGRSAAPSGITELHHKAFCYDPLAKKWFALNDVSDGMHITNLSAATGVAIGKNNILIIGGDRGNIFHQIETYNAAIEKSVGLKKEQLLAAKLKLVINHPGFSRDMLIYNTITNSWRKAGELPFYGHVTTTAVKWDNDIFIPAGEIKPGIRTSDIVRGELLHEIK